MEQIVLMIVVDYRGRHRKGIPISNATEVSLKQQHFLMNKNVLLKIANGEKSFKNKLFWFYKFVLFFLLSGSQAVGQNKESLVRLYSIC
jgi:hypothetical protein